MNWEAGGGELGSMKVELGSGRGDLGSRRW